ncbi:MAG: fumarylacetoacetate hydrolase family protein [Sphingomonadales bacterium]
MRYAFDEHPQISVGIIGEESRFPIRRVYNVARNYKKHVVEMGGELATNIPAYFLKPCDSVVECPAKIAYPMGTKDCHHEIELVVALGQGGVNIGSNEVEDMIYGYGVGIDLTRRDLQDITKKKRGPWDTAKSFDNSAPLSQINKASEIGHPKSGKIWLDINGERRQEGNISDLIVSVSELLVDLSTLYELKAGDLIYTGTPAGVGPIHKGDHITGGVEGVGELSLVILG